MKVLDLARLPARTTRDAYGEALVEVARRDARVVALDADLSGSTKSNLFARAFPDRFFNAGIAEQNMVGLAAGLAAAGKIPFCSSFAIFVTGRAFEQVRQSVAAPCLPVRLVGSHAGVTVGADGSSHQAIEDVALMRVLPGMTVLVPADAVATRDLVLASMDVNGPVYLRLGRAAVPTIYCDEAFGPREFAVGGSARLLPGTDATIVASGVMVAEALNAAYRAREEGLLVGVIDAYSLKPLDAPAIRQAALESGALVTAEEHSVIGGLGAAVAEAIGETCPVPLVRIGLQDRFGESGAPDDLLRLMGLTAADILAAVRRAVAAKRR
jgi:transketolase